MTVYLDCNATTPTEPAVAAAVNKYMLEEYGNAGSRTHEFGARAKTAVQTARDQVAALVGASREEVVFTSGATESNNLAILGLAPYGEKAGRRHIITSAIEHKAVLEPIEYLESRGFEVTRVPVDASGHVNPQAVRESLRADTLLVSIMHVNNETGIWQPIKEIAEVLDGSDAYLHVDAAQGFGKIIDDLQSPRVDLISVSGHKIFGPKGIGALIVRRRGYRRLPLTPLLYGGGQERGLRPGTLPVPLVVGLGVAAELASKNHKARAVACREIRDSALAALKRLDIDLHGDQERVLPHVLNFSVPNVDAEAAMVSLKGIAALSNGSACTSQSYTASHVLLAMGLNDAQISSALRISWSHLTEYVDWEEFVNALARLR